MICALTLGVILNPAVGAALMMLQTLLIFVNVYCFSASATRQNTEAKRDAHTPLAAPDLNGDVPGIGNRVGLAYTHTKALQTEGAVDAISNMVADGFNEIESPVLH